MFKSKFIISLFIFFSFLIVTSIIKNKTRFIEKKINDLNHKILFFNKEINEAQLDFFYLSSPREIEKRVKIIGLNNYHPIKFSNIFFDISELEKIKNKVSILKK